jgi:hypothetical protein
MALLPLAGFTFLVVALFNALVPRDISATPAKPLTFFGFNQNGEPLNSLGTPADTVKTKKIKIVKVKEHPDSTITETYDVKVVGDTARGTKIVYYNDKKMEGDTTRVVYVITKDHPEIMLTEDPDSLDVLVKTNVMHKEKIVITKDINVNTSVDNVMSDVLYIIDGVEHKEKDALLNTAPNTIESINVIKDKQMMKKYTDKDYEGVIIVKTKKSK